MDAYIGSYPVERVDRSDERHEAFVYCAGRHRITISDCDRLGLEAGAILDEDGFALLLEAEQRLACVQKALSLLEYGDLSKRRMIEKLRMKFSPELAAETADLLEERGYLNDSALAKRYAENYYEVRAYGPMRIKQELYRKGFSMDVIEEALESYRTEDHREKITQLLLGKYSSEQLSDPAVRQKANAWLSRQGYSWSEISDVLQTIL